MRGSWVPEHVTATFEPREASALRQVLADVESMALAEPGTDGYFALNELEAEVIANLVEILEARGDPAERAAGR